MRTLDVIFDESANALSDISFQRHMQSINLLRSSARAFRKRGEPKQVKHRTVKAHVGRGKGKSGNFSISTERLER